MTNVSSTTASTSASMANMTATISATNVVTTAGTQTTLSTSGTVVGKRDINHISNHLHRRQASQLTASSRKKRQATLTYGGIVGLPLTFGVVLPQSCCTPSATLTSNTSNVCMYFMNNLAKKKHFFKILF
jgi:hypothetical protein